MISLLKSAIRYKALTLFTVLLLMGAGIYSYFMLPQNEDPSISPGLMKVFVYWPGATPEDMETFIAKPMEQAISQYSHIKYQKSECLPWISIITIRFSDEVSGSDVDTGYQKIRNYIGDIRTKLPEGIVGPFYFDRIAETEAYVLGLTSESGTRSYRELEALLENIRDELKTVDGVADCNFYGKQNEKISIELSTDDLKSLGIHPGQIIEGIKSRNIQMIQPSLNLSGKQLYVEVTGNYRSVEEIKNTIVYTDASGKVYRIRDLRGKVSHSYQDPPEGFVAVNGQKSLVLTVSMKRGFHIVRWGNRMDRRIDELRRRLPSDVTLTTLFNQPRAVNHSVDGFMKNFYEAIILVVIILGMGLGIRNAGIVALAIPLIICVTFSLMNLMKIELQQMSISALIIVLGMIVDNSVVVIDNIDRYLRKGYPRIEAAIKGASEMAPALFTGTVTIVSAFFVLIFITGSMGDYIRALPSVICIALAVSFFAALLVSPTLAAILSRSQQAEEDRRISMAQKVYNRFVDITQKHRAMSLAVLGLLCAATVFLVLNFVAISFFPAADKTQFVANVYLPEGSDVGATAEKVAIIEKKLEEMRKTPFNGNGKPMVSDYVCYVGLQGPRFYINLMPRPPQARYAHIMVSTPGGKETKAAAEELRNYIARNVAGAQVDVMLLELGVPIDYPVELRLSGTDIGTLRRIGRTCEKILSGTRGITSVNNDYGIDSQKIVIKVDQERARILGLSSADVAATLYTGIQGLPVSKLKAPERQIDITVRLEKGRRESIDDLKAMLFTSSTTGKKHRLDEFAEVCLANCSSAIARRNERRTITIGAYVRGRLPDDILKEIRPKLAAVKLPYGYSLRYGGQQEESNAAFGQLIPLAALGLVLMFLTLSCKFKSIRIALAIFMSIPTALIGAFAGMVIMKQSLGFMSAIGLSSLCGIVVYNAVVMVEFIHERLKSGEDVLEVIKEAGFLRVRPILMTATCAIAGLMPLALSRNPMFESLCWVIIFGTAFSTVMTLLMTPLFFVVLGGLTDSLRIIADEKAQSEGPRSVAPQAD